jgi:hypothetical protein
MNPETPNHIMGWLWHEMKKCPTLYQELELYSSSKYIQRSGPGHKNYILFHHTHMPSLKHLHAYGYFSGPFH